MQSVGLYKWNTLKDYKVWKFKDITDQILCKKDRKYHTNSQITSNDIEQPPNSQLSDSSTITLSSPGQTIDISQESKQVAEKECQTADGVFLEKEK